MSHPYKQHRDAERKIARTRYRAEGGGVSANRWLGEHQLRQFGNHPHEAKVIRDLDAKSAQYISDKVPRRPYRDVLDVKVHD